MTHTAAVSDARNEFGGRVDYLLQTACDVAGVEIRDSVARRLTLVGDRVFGFDA
jgi:hypothetical protein